MKNKIHINDTILFKEVASVIGHHRAIVELSSVSSHGNCSKFNLDAPLDDAFFWEDSPQGYEFWDCIDHKIIEALVLEKLNSQHLIEINTKYLLK